MNKLLKDNPPKCVQCQKNMMRAFGNKNKWEAPFCEYPECPNYGLLQTGILRGHSRIEKKEE